MAPFNIAIIGAGIGGPAAAIGLARNGHKVTVYERSTKTSEVGYAFRITPNSDRCLKHLSVDTIAGGAVAATSGCLMDAEGNVLREFTENAGVEEAKRGTSVFAYRPQLHQQLMDVAHKEGVEMKIGVKVNSVDVDKTQLLLEDGSSISADIIIAADGVRSVVRAQITDTSKRFPTASTGHNAFRFTVPTQVAKNDDILKPILTSNARFVCWSGHNRRILSYPVDYDRKFNITCTHSQELSDKEATGDNATAVAYNQSAPLSTVLDIYKDFHPAVIRLLNLADPNGFRVWKLVDMDEIPSWSRKRTVLIGDACHPVLAFGFSGASMAIEDAVTLAELLPADVEVGDVEERLRLYEEIRKPRVGMVRDTGRRIARGDDSIGKYMRALAEHDAVVFAREALAEHLHRRG
ncbi:MAG: hypothetical protein LQ338_004423 [Usnochroma carphineum]|nr:MAG: hypothetical protein LQ338_004423 [Usnochroma carphineum]